MKKQPNPKPTAAELEILQVLWRHGPATVRFVNTRLNESKETGYTTTLKIMQIMFEKGMLERIKQSRSHIYKPAFKKEKIQRILLQSFVDKTFGGSSAALVMQALGNHKASPEELQKIRDLLDDIEQESK